MKHTSPSETMSPTAPSRVRIHANSSDDEAAQHPSWHGAEDKELTEFPFALDELEAESGTDGMSEINSRIERLLDKAPSDSSANLLLKKTKDGYRAFFRVRSAQNRFAGFITGRRLIDVVERVLKDVRSQIDDWKENRKLLDEPV